MIYGDVHHPIAVVLVHMCSMEGLDASQTATVDIHLNTMEDIFVLYVNVREHVLMGSHCGGNVVVQVHVSHLQQESLWKMDSQKEC